MHAQVSDPTTMAMALSAIFIVTAVVVLLGNRRHPQFREGLRFWGLRFVPAMLGTTWLIWLVMPKP